VARDARRMINSQVLARSALCAGRVASRDQVDSYDEIIVSTGRTAVVRYYCTGRAATERYKTRALRQFTDVMTVL